MNRRDTWKYRSRSGERRRAHKHWERVDEKIHAQTAHTKQEHGEMSMLWMFVYSGGMVKPWEVYRVIHSPE